jgi:anti-anti-sigma regulatory factor
MNSVNIQMALDGAATRVAISGEFTENANFSELLGAQTPAIVLDLSGVRRINSCGVREWVHLVEALKHSGRSVELERCSVPFVAQLNMIVNFSGGARVRSFYAPYLCPNCNTEHAELCEMPDSAPPTVREFSKCPSCGSVSEFDDIPYAYLAFTRG